MLSAEFSKYLRHDKGNEYAEKLILEKNDLFLGIIILRLCITVTS
jgi:hypothetical protein